MSSQLRFCVAKTRHTNSPTTAAIPAKYRGRRSLDHLAEMVSVSTREVMTAWADTRESPATTANPSAAHKNLSAVPTSAHSEGVRD